MPQLPPIFAPPSLVSFSQSHPLILGSSSEWRRKVLEIAGCSVHSCVSPDIDEKAIRARTPEEMSMLIARAKAVAVHAKIKDTVSIATSSRLPRIVICSDQVAVCDSVVREKPESEEEARKFIASYSSGSPVSTVTALVVSDLVSGRTAEGTHTATVKFKPISEASIDKLVKGRVVYTCCGGFSVDDPEMGKWVEKIEGGVDSVMGLPLCLLSDLIEQVISE